jgi:Cys-rich protein (TIGR01571 family)
MTGQITHVQLGPRAEIRQRYGIRGNMCKDWFAVCCCSSCALTQERREVEMEEASFAADENRDDEKSPIG